MLDVGVPLAAGAVIELHEPHAPLDQPPGQQAVAAEGLGLFLVDAVQLSGRLRLLRQVDRLGGCGLHAEGQFVAGDAGLQLALLRARWPAWRRLSCASRSSLPF